MKDKHPDSKPSPSLLSMLGSLFAALFGIQSDRNRERDFKKGEPRDYIVMGILAVIGLIIIMIIVVSSVLSSAGLNS